MRIKKLICFLLLPLAFLTSCKIYSDDATAKETYSSIVNHVLNDDVDELKKLFAYNVSSQISNFDEKIYELTEYVTGNYVSSKYEGNGAEYTMDGFKQTRFLPVVACELYTTDSKYFFSMLYCSIDDYDANNVGIWNLMVQKCNNENDAFKPYSSYEEWMNSDKYRGIKLI